MEQSLESEPNQRYKSDLKDLSWMLDE